MVGQAEEGGHMMGDALTVVSKTGERWYETGIHRLTGELCLQQAGPNAHHAERNFPPSPRPCPPAAGEIPIPSGI
jgi:hypothetical protein